MKTISILGSTGSIGTQTLEVISTHSNLFKLNFITTNTNIKLLEEQCHIFNPNGVVIADEQAYKQFLLSTNFKGKILAKQDGINEAAADTNNDLVVIALVGFSGTIPTLTAINNNINIALANKETLVTAGSIITQSAKKHNVSIYPIDSEHSAIFQCLQGEQNSEVSKLILTASGGPFFNYSDSQLEDVTAENALKHPTWKMGNKVSIDSATMMNKGFEVIEAFWLFGFSPDKIDVVVHPQSIVHSMVQFMDGSIKAQLGNPDMRIPISYALSYPSRISNKFNQLSFADLTLSFVPVNYDKFRCLSIAFDAIKRSGNLPAIVNAANEIAVAAFLNNKIKFTQIPSLISRSIDNFQFIPTPSIDDIIDCDTEVKKYASSIVNS